MHVTGLRAWPGSCCRQHLAGMRTSPVHACKTRRSAGCPTGGSCTHHIPKPGLIHEIRACLLTGARDIVGSPCCRVRSMTAQRENPERTRTTLVTPSASFLVWTRSLASMAFFRLCMLPVPWCGQLPAGLPSRRGKRARQKLFRGHANPITTVRGRKTQGVGTSARRTQEYACS